MSRNHRPLILALIATALACGKPSKTKSDFDASPPRQAPSNETMARLESLAEVISTQPHQVRLFHQNLKLLEIDPDLRQAAAATKFEGYGLNPYFETARLYIQGASSPRLNIDAQTLVGRQTRTPSFLEHITLLCRTSSRFAGLIRQEFPDGFGTSCSGTTTETKELAEGDLPRLLWQSLRTATANQSRLLLLASTLDDPRAASALVSAPPLSLGRLTKVLAMLKPLQLATIFYAANIEHRGVLMKLLDSDNVTARVKSRVVLALAWHGDPRVDAHLPWLFSSKLTKGETISTDALALVAERIQNPDIGAAIFSTMFASTNVSTEKLSKLALRSVPAETVSRLVTTALTKKPGHPKAWFELQSADKFSSVDWRQVFESNVSTDGMNTILLNLVHNENKLPKDACVALIETHAETLDKRGVDLALRVTRRSDCLSDQSVAKFVGRGSGEAQFILFSRAKDTEKRLVDFFKQCQTDTCVTFANTLLQKTMELKGLKNKVSLIKVFLKKLPATPTPYPFLRLTKTLVAQISDRDRRVCAPQILEVMPGFVFGQNKKIHTDALVILETLGTKPAKNIIRKALGMLNEGSVRDKLYLRFGHLLSAKPK